MGPVLQDRTFALVLPPRDYLDTALSKGLSEMRVILRHAFPNALVAAVSVIGVRFGSMLGGLVIRENVFGPPGLGRLLVQGVTSSDYPMIQYTVLMFAIISWRSAD